MLSLPSRLSSRTRYGAAALMLAVAASLSGCNDSNIPRGVAGYYILKTVNGEPVPTTVTESGSYKLEILSGSFTIDATGTYSSAGLYRETEGGESQQFYAYSGGTWERSGTTITFTEGEVTLEGSLESNVLTIDESGVEAVFERAESD
jgi:hypothetical protein